jgi:DNA-binding helix-hairpin-helix protein with protein kinase domain
MPFIKGSNSIQSAYNPEQRFRYFTKYGWDFQVRVARNLCAAFDELHKTGCLVGDVNQSNALVDQAAFVKFVDCDSFQIPSKPLPFICEVGVPHYTPPELQDKNFRGLVRTVNHDCFGLAVLVYQLIFVGRHPYAGIYEGKEELSPQEFIKNYLFANGPNCSKNRMRPPPYMPRFKDIPTDLGNLFCRSFEIGSQNNCRPKANEWITPLKNFEKEIIECKRDLGHRFWRHSGGCVWCEIQKHQGPNYFFGADPKNPIKEITHEDLEKVKEAIASWNWDNFNYSRKALVNRIDLSKTETEDLSEIFDGYEEHDLQQKILKIASCFCLSLSVFFVFFKIWLIVVPGAVGFCIFFVLYLYISRFSKIGSIESRLLNDKDEAENDLIKIEKEWANTLKKNRKICNKFENSIDAMIIKILTLEEQADDAIRIKMSKLKEDAIVRHLKMHSITEAEIPSIGALRKSILVRNNIKTAFYINETAILRIKGFDKVLLENLLNWRHSVDLSFSFRPQEGLSKSERYLIKKEINNQQNLLYLEILVAKKKIFEVFSKNKKDLSLIEEKIIPKIQKYYATCKVVQNLPGSFN